MKLFGYSAKLSFSETISFSPQIYHFNQSYNYNNFPLKIYPNKSKQKPIESSSVKPSKKYIPTLEEANTMTYFMNRNLSL